MGARAKVAGIDVRGGDMCGVLDILVSLKQEERKAEKIADEDRDKDTYVKET